MGSGNLQVARAIAASFVLFVPMAASAHAYIKDPPSRDVAEANLNARAKKAGPCGGSPRTSTPTQFAVGQEITVTWEETIGHTGCYQIAFSPANDKDWVTLAQIDDPAEKQNVQSAKVKLPAGVSCKDCTLVVRQLMLENEQNKTCARDAAPPPTNTYYSCADIRVGDFPDAGPTLPPSDGGSGDGDDGENSSGGVSTTPTDGGGKTNGANGGRRLSSVDADAGGCSIALGATSGFSLATSIALGLMAVARRRRRRQ
jgi:Lytic polysaccharide mono-oxygenase, cellulose-degrading